MSTEHAKRIEDPLAAALPELQNFSLVLGGPLYQFLRKARLDDDAGRLAGRRVVVLSGIAWLPLLVLCAFEGTLLGGVDIPFLLDIETHARFLLAVPLMILAELLVHQRMRIVVGQFLERTLVPPASLPRFIAALRAAMAWRNSKLVELALLVLVYPVGYYIRGEFLALDSPTWYASVGYGTITFTFAGIWFSFVSNPIIQFLLLRWAYRLMIWARFLWQVSRIELDLIPTHPDRNGGLGFLGNSAFAFAPLLSALGASVAGMIANRIFHQGASLAAFRLEIVILVAFGMLLVLGPLLVFAPMILAAQRKGLREYGAFAAEYTRSFDRRWLRSSDREGEQLLGSGDIQSLADLGNAFAVIREMKAAIFSRAIFVQLTVATLIPFVPLVFTMIPLEQLLDRIIGAIF
jgi:hypothetical protein